MSLSVKINIGQLQQFLAKIDTEESEDFVLVSTYLDDEKMYAEFQIPDKDDFTYGYSAITFSSEPYDMTIDAD